MQMPPLLPLAMACCCCSCGGQEQEPLGGKQTATPDAPANMMGCLARARPVALASRAVMVTPLGLSRLYSASSLSVVML